MQSNFGYEKMRSKRKEFRVGDTVIWERPISQEHRINIANCRKEYGDGPFVVRKIQKVPRKRDMLKAVGHHQWVWIDDSKQKLSGALFKKVMG
ncbi:MAG: hypothetical protein HZC03_00140 [Candidatus Lloydbacteria bacterium]|nr:hypothetical protein [Candidatus Lloydbacteria bacterium]